MFFFVLAAACLALLFLTAGVLFALDDRSASIRSRAKSMLWSAAIRWYCRFHIWKNQCALVWEFGRHVLLQTPKRNFRPSRSDCDGSTLNVYWLGFDASDPDHRPALRQWYRHCLSASLESFIKSLIETSHPALDSLVIALVDKDGQLGVEEHHRLEQLKADTSLLCPAASSAQRGHMVVRITQSNQTPRYNFRPKTAEQHRHRAVNPTSQLHQIALTAVEETILLSALIYRTDSCADLFKKIIGQLPNVDGFWRLLMSSAADGPCSCAVECRLRCFDQYGSELVVPINL